MNPKKTLEPDGEWCVKTSKSSKSRTSNSRNNSPDISKKIENYIDKAQRFNHSEEFIQDLKELKAIATSLTHVQGLTCSWIIK
jgi:hypothetical protein